MTAYLIANVARFPHETIDGETLLIDSASGHLVLLGGIGATLWQRLLGGAAVDPLIGEIAMQFGAEAGAACGAFLQALTEAQIAVAAASAGAAAVPPPAWPAAFVAPTLECYDDIADIIAMDPIHDVDQGAGWPRRPGDADS